MIRQLEEPDINLFFDDLRQVMRFDNKQSFVGKGYCGVMFKNIASTSAGPLELGSMFELNGVFFVSETDTLPAGTPVANSKNFVYTDGINLYYSNAAPQWNRIKGGWYKGNDRALLRFYYAASAFRCKTLINDYESMYGLLVGSYYTQYPAAASNDPNTAFPMYERPEMLFGGTWAAQFESGKIFFRTGGTLASEPDRSVGLQADAMRNIEGTIYNSVVYGAGIRGTGVLLQNGNRVGSAEGGSGSHFGADTLHFNLEYSDELKGHISTEIRPVNRRMIVWKRTA